ncbi:hypothetical protein [Hansschlegelia zhihuaiae]|uniref:Uncharacterized protein n=1 Tax=Hansschlegelia zhihuaiae TaxID=405005 RepID=A0A4Q0M4V2_9HYPH|nr:hypothetical protein [Hansschlegelia zhihuaiae]RXF67945.1 hypothetical protein EK403_20685 [Hansschlegelia zhihuaiae]
MIEASADQASTGTDIRRRGGAGLYAYNGPSCFRAISSRRSGGSASVVVDACGRLSTSRFSGPFVVRASEEAETMPDIDTEGLSFGALGRAVAELRELAGQPTPDALKRCDSVVGQLDAQAIDRRHRASSMRALQLAVLNRMPTGQVKAHVEARLSAILKSIEHEGRFDASTRQRSAFSGIGG